MTKYSSKKFSRENWGRATQAGGGGLDAYKSKAMREYTVREYTVREYVRE